MRFVLGLAAVLVGFVANVSAQNCPVLGPDSLRCQQGVGRAGSVYVKIKMKAVQKCLNKIQSGDLTGDPVTVCRGTRRRIRAGEQRLVMRGERLR